MNILERTNHGTEDDHLSETPPAFTVIDLLEILAVAVVLLWVVRLIERSLA